ncbi:hypothetical protein [Shinella zoogloeoides]|uniref:hypothetical protein n=1 Tax=Shinella zoogloeoides TaxID=352475 RepID=UPI001F55FFF0|nr:hypothetical protein [Shinella zoogloeoides]
MTDTAQPFDADREYDLVVSRVVPLGPFKYRPRDKIIAKGSLLNRIVEEHGADAIRTAEPR